MGEKIAKETEKGQLRKQVSQGSVALEKPKKESSGKRASECRFSGSACVTAELGSKELEVLKQTQ